VRFRRASGCPLHLALPVLHFANLQEAQRDFDDRLSSEAVQSGALCYCVEMVKPCGRPAVITVGDAEITREVTCGFPAESM